MPNLLYLQQDVLRQVYQDLNPKVIGEYPTLGYFERVPEVSGKDVIEMATQTVVSRAGSAKAPNAPSENIQREGIVTKFVKIPEFSWKDPITPQEFSVLMKADADLRAGKKGSKEASLALVRAVSRLMAMEKATKERMTSSVLQGALRYSVAGTTFTETYPVPVIASPSTSWGDAAAPLVADIYRIFQDFDTNSGIAPASVFISANTFNTVMIPNTQFMSFVHDNPQLAQLFGGLGGAGAPPFDTSVNRTVLLMGRTWHIISGTVTLPDGTTEARWPDNVISLIAPTKNGLPTVTMPTLKSRATPNGGVSLDSFETKDPDETVLRLSTSGVPKLIYAGAVQTCTVVF